MTERLPFDRFVEIGLEWFQPAEPDRQAAQLHERLAPLWDAVDGRCGLVVNTGWVIDVITEWTGDPRQRLPFRSRRLAHWSRATYADLGALVAAVRRATGRPDLYVGILVVGWGNFVWPVDTQIYDFASHWYDRHPELYPTAQSLVGMPDLDPRVPLRADDYCYATQPDGLLEGADFPTFFGAQWGNLAAELDLDVLHLRDAFLGPMVYSRIGPNGTSAPDDVQEIQSWTRSVSSLFRSAKDARPEALVLGYSSAISAIAERRVGLVDLTQVVADGGIDVWVDQTWGGAWQDWWDHHWKGWTFQVANLLLHGLLVADGNRRRAPEDGTCAHWNLIETWDSWEPWDTLHRTPDKLRWGIWALSHASVVGADSPRAPRGSYISWANYRDGALMSPADVAFVGRHLDAAQASAAGLESVLGPTLLFDPASLSDLERRGASGNYSEWLDDQAALLMKFATPVLSIARPDTFVPTLDGVITTLPKSVPEVPVLASGRADVLPNGVLERLGVATTELHHRADFVDGHAVGHDDLPESEVVHLPERRVVVATTAEEVAYTTSEGPVVVRRGNATWWQPPDWSAPPLALLPRSQLGTAAVHAVASRLLAGRVAEVRGSRAEAVALHEPVCWHAWVSDGAVHVLVGNLESGWLGDSRHARRVVIHLGDSVISLLPPGPLQLEPLTHEDGEAIVSVGSRFEIDVPPEGCRVLRLAPAPATTA